MSLIRFQPHAVAVTEPMAELDGFNRQVDDLFRWAFGRDYLRDASATTVPAMDVVAHVDHYRVTVDLPGMKRDDVEITYHNGALSIHGEKKLAPDSGEGKTVHSERWAGKFSRSFRLPAKVAADRIEASFDHGVLVVKLPFTPEAQPKRIEIHGS